MSRIVSFLLSTDVAIDDQSMAKVGKTKRPPHSGVNSSENPLHVAAKLGQPQVVTEILPKDPKLALELNREGYTALHLACWSGHLEVARLLIEANPELCLVKDKYGRTPLHTAAMKGRESVLRELLGACPESVMELTAGCETPLHVAVTHAQVKAVRLLVDWLKEENLYHDLINKKDCSGNTVLHLATSRKQLQTIKLILLDNSPPYCAMVEVNAINDGGFTALDILDVLPQCGKKDMEIEKYLQRAGALRAKDVVEPTLDDGSQEVFIKFKRNWNQPSQTTWPMKTRYRPPSDSYHLLLLTATLLASITFYTALHPPGDRLEESYKYKSSMNSIFQIEKRNSIVTRLFILFNSIAFFTSIAIIIVVMHELPLKPLSLISVFSMLGAYVCSIMVVSPREAIAVLSLCSPAILLAAASKYLAVNRMVLENLRWIWIRIYPII